MDFQPHRNPNSAEATLQSWGTASRRLLISEEHAEDVLHPTKGLDAHGQSSWSSMCAAVGVSRQGDVFVHKVKPRINVGSFHSFSRPTEFREMCCSTTGYEQPSLASAFVRPQKATDVDGDAGKLMP